MRFTTASKRPSVYMNTFTITNTKIFHHNNPPNDDRDVNHWQVGYGYHKETKCSSHPKKSCHDVAKHVRIKMKIMILIISSRSHLPTHERSVTRSQRKSVTRFPSRSADFYLFFFPMSIFLNSLEMSMVFVSHVLDLIQMIKTCHRCQRRSASMFPRQSAPMSPSRLRYPSHSRNVGR